MSYKAVNLGQLWLNAVNAGEISGLRMNQEERTAQDWYTKMQTDAKNASEIDAARKRISDANGEGAGGMAQLAKDQNAQGSYVMNYMMQKHGYSKDAAGVIAGNLFHESKFNTSIEGDKSLGAGRTAFGLAQWREVRLTNLKNFANGSGKAWTDFDTQLDFVAKELKQPAYAKAERSLRTAGNSVRQMSDDFDAHYEISNGAKRGDRAANSNAFIANYSPDITTLKLRDGSAYGSLAPAKASNAPDYQPGGEGRPDANGQPTSKARTYVEDANKNSPSYGARTGIVRSIPYSGGGAQPPLKFTPQGSNPIEGYGIEDGPSPLSSKPMKKAEASADDIFMEGYMKAFETYAQADPIRYTPQDEEAA